MASGIQNKRNRVLGLGLFYLVDETFPSDRKGPKLDAVAAAAQNDLLKKTPLRTTFLGNFLAPFGGGGGNNGRGLRR